MYYQCSIAVRKHDDHNSSYKGKYLIGDNLQFIIFMAEIIETWRQTWLWRGTLELYYEIYRKQQVAEIGSGLSIWKP